MNKQEAIEQINYMDTLNINDKAACQQVDMVIKNQVLDIINQIDEPQKPKVPQFVADWYEENKDYFEDKVYDLCVQFNFDESELNSDVAEWFGHSKSKPFETLVKMKLYGYEIEKEKLYTVKIPIANSPLGYHYVLRKTTPGKIIIDSFFTDNWGNYDYCQLTEEEIKKDHGWAWKYAEEVK